MVSQETRKVSEVRRDLTDLLNRVAFQDHSVVIERHGKKVAALVPIEAYRLLERMIDRLEEQEDARELPKLLDDDRVSFEDVAKGIL